MSETGHFFVVVSIYGYKSSALYHKQIYKTCTVIIPRKALQNFLYQVCLAVSPIMLITNNNVSHPSVHITAGIAHSVLHVSAILNVQKDKYISMNL